MFSCDTWKKYMTNLAWDPDNMIDHVSGYITINLDVNICACVKAFFVQ